MKNFEKVNFNSCLRSIVILPMNPLCVDIQIIAIEHCTVLLSGTVYASIAGLF